MVEAAKIKDALVQLEEQYKKGFKQTVECIITLKDIDLKKNDQQVDTHVTLHHDLGKTVKVCGLMGPELADDAKTVFEGVLTEADFQEYAKDKKKAKKLADEYDYFVAQANIMSKVAASFGRVLGPRGKMPNPKAGCVVPPKADLAALHERLKRTVRVRTGTSPMVQVAVGKESQDPKEVADNAAQVYDALMHGLPQGINNIKAVYIKLTMSPAKQVS